MQMSILPYLCLWVTHWHMRKINLFLCVYSSASLWKNVCVGVAPCMWLLRGLGAVWAQASWAGVKWFPEWKKLGAPCSKELLRSVMKGGKMLYGSLCRLVCVSKWHRIWCLKNRIKIQSDETRFIFDATRNLLKTAGYLVYSWPIVLMWFLCVCVHVLCLFMRRDWERWAVSEQVR